MLGAGCGGGDDASDDSPRAQFIERADAACAAAREDLMGMGRAARTPRGIQRLADRTERLAEEIRAADPPPADRAAIDGYLDRLRRVAAKLRELAELVRSGDGPRARAGTRDLVRLATGAARQAREYGFEECGRGVGAAG